MDEKRSDARKVNVTVRNNHFAVEMGLEIEPAQLWQHRSHVTIPLEFHADPAHRRPANTFAALAAEEEVVAEQIAPLDASGMFEREKLELVDGELISKMGKNRPHVIAFTWMHLWLLETFGKEFVNAEAPIDVSPSENAWNEPVPDLIVLKHPFVTFESNPQPGDLRLVVEIADSSLQFDIGVKAALYARAGIVE